MQYILHKREMARDCVFVFVFFQEPANTLGGYKAIHLGKSFHLSTNSMSLYYIMETYEIFTQIGSYHLVGNGEEWKNPSLF